jgi:hypothetical protein
MLTYFIIHFKYDKASGLKFVGQIQIKVPRAGKDTRYYRIIQNYIDSGVEMLNVVRMFVITFITQVQR